VLFPDAITPPTATTLGRSRLDRSAESASRKQRRACASWRMNEAIFARTYAR
jgi:hypothetical protein